MYIICTVSQGINFKSVSYRFWVAESEFVSRFASSRPGFEVIKKQYENL